MTSDLVTIRQIHNPLELTERDREAAQAVASGLRGAKAPNTRRAYASAWLRFQAWADAATQLCPPVRRPWPSTWATWRPPAAPLPPSSWPAPPSPISTPPQACRRTTTPPATRWGPRPSGAGVTGPRPPGQADALTADALVRVREALRLPRRGRGGRMESAETAQRRAALDLAIIGVLADGGLRRSEAADLTWGDVELWPDGTARLTVQKGKNQPEPATVAVTAATARALRETRPDDATPTTAVFGLTGEALANRVRAAARAAGLGDGFNGHSGRIGMARRMVAAGAPNAAVQHQGRWKHGDMVARYTRGEAAGEALKWLT